jgi:hypothetical protein
LFCRPVESPSRDDDHPGLAHPHGFDPVEVLSGGCSSATCRRSVSSEIVCITPFGGQSDVGESDSSRELLFSTNKTEQSYEYRKQDR